MFNEIICSRFSRLSSLTLCNSDGNFVDSISFVLRICCKLERFSLFGFRLSSSSGRFSELTMPSRLKSFSISGPVAVLQLLKILPPSLEHFAIYSPSDGPESVLTSECAILLSGFPNLTSLWIPEHTSTQVNFPHSFVFSTDANADTLIIGFLKDVTRCLLAKPGHTKFQLLG